MRSKWTRYSMSITKSSMYSWTFLPMKQVYDTQIIHVHRTYVLFEERVSLSWTYSAIKSGSWLWSMAYTCSYNINEHNSKKPGFLDLKQEDVTALQKDFIKLLTFLLPELSLITLRKSSATTNQQYILLPNWRQRLYQMLSYSEQSTNFKSFLWLSRLLLSHIKRRLLQTTKITIFSKLPLEPITKVECSGVFPNKLGHWPEMLWSFHASGSSLGFSLKSNHPDISNT